MMKMKMKFQFEYEFKNREQTSDPIWWHVTLWTGLLMEMVDKLVELVIQNEDWSHIQTKQTNKTPVSNFSFYFHPILVVTFWSIGL